MQATLKRQVQDELAAKVDQNTYIITESISYVPSAEAFNHKLGDEADDLNLKLTLTSRGVSISKTDLDSLVSNQIGPQIPAGFVAVGDYRSDFVVREVNGTQSSLKLTAAVPLRPQLDESKIASDISGKSLKSAESYLGSLPSISRVSLVVSPPLPPPLLTLPRIPAKISLELVPAEP